MVIRNRTHSISEVCLNKGFFEERAGAGGAGAVGWGKPVHVRSPGRSESRDSVRIEKGSNCPRGTPEEGTSAERSLTCCSEVGRRPVRGREVKHLLARMGVAGHRAGSVLSGRQGDNMSDREGSGVAAHRRGGPKPRRSPQPGNSRTPPTLRCWHLGVGTKQMDSGTDPSLGVAGLFRENDEGGRG